MKTKIFLSAGLLLVIGCQSRAFRGEADTASVSTFRNVKANHCEIFIDKAAISEKPDPTTGGKLQTLFTFVKVDASRLDGPVRKVVWYGQYTRSSDYGRDGGNNWLETNLESQDSAPDYFKNELPLVKLYTYAGRSTKELFRHSGAFFVETEKGTRYWANANEKDNFDFDMDLFMGGSIPELRILTSFSPTFDTVVALKKTKENGEIGRFFNPQGCQ